MKPKLGIICMSGSNIIMLDVTIFLLLTSYNKPMMWNSNFLYATLHIYSSYYYLMHICIRYYKSHIYCNIHCTYIRHYKILKKSITFSPNAISWNPLLPLYKLDYFVLHLFYTNILEVFYIINCACYWKEISI